MVRLPAVQMTSLTSNDTLHTLIARQNKMGNMTAQALGNMLLQNSALKSLNIAWNVVGPVGAAAIATGITFNSTLEVRQSRLAHSCLDDALHVG